MLKKLVAVLVAGFALGQWAAFKQHSALKRKLDTPKPKPDELSNWEGEGGALPTAGAQPGPGSAKR